VPPDTPPPFFYFDKLLSLWQLHTLRACCELGIPDLLGGGPVPLEVLAEKSGAKPETLYRMMRALANLGVFAETAPGTFGHTVLSELLQSGVPGSMHWMLIAELAPERFPAWFALPDSIRTGETAYENVVGKPLWEYYRDDNPAQGEAFSRWMTGASHAIIDAIHQAFDFSRYETVVDIAGGQGALLASILDRNPHQRGILFDLPEVTARAIEHPRITRVAGSFFESVLEGGDLYTLKWIIHDWEESKAIQILRNVRKAMSPGAELMLIEGIVSDGPEPDFIKWMDINMLVMAGGRERTAAEYGELLDKSGFRVDRIVPTQSIPSLILATV
jgi:hypothetical protein